jgi:hypothetical protein
MSIENRDVPKLVTICDLCNDIIPKGEHPMDTASLSHGYIAHKVTERTKRVWFHWPDLNRPGFSRTREQEREARAKRVEWDFHAECVYEALKAAIDGRQPSDPLCETCARFPEAVSSHPHEHPGTWIELSEGEPDAL